MKSVNGIFLIVIAVFVLWIGVSGRFPRLMEAIGIIRGTDPMNKNSSKSSTQNSGSGSPIVHTSIGDSNKILVSGGGQPDKIIENEALFSPANLWKMVNGQAVGEPKAAGGGW